MMKYACNHYDNFTNPYAAWTFGFLVTVCALAVEFDVMIILTSIPDIINVINKYVSLAAITNIPRFYYASIKEHKFIKVNQVKLKITEHRHNNPLKMAPYPIKFLRFIYKLLRTLFTSVSYYFMPFLSIFLNFKHMINQSIDEQSPGDTEHSDFLE